jgi:glycosyltransferase involved in cell wall biosynthesis
VIWSILVATHVSRGEQFARLVDMLAPQLAPDVEVSVLWNRGDKNIGEYRQALVEDARGEYVSFVDDDDRLPDYYVAAILEALKSKPDCVGFRVQVRDLSERPISSKYRDYVAFHSIRYDRWYQKGHRFFRNVTHLNPVRRDLAVKVPFVGNRAEDHEWAKRVGPLLKSEVYVDRPMYFYDFAQDKSIRSGIRRDGSKVPRPPLPDGFRYHPDSED